MKGRSSSFVFEIVLLFTFLLLPFCFLPCPWRYFYNFTPPSHLHIGCHSDVLSVPAGAAGRSWVDYVPWFLHNIIFTVLVLVSVVLSCVCLYFTFLSGFFLPLFVLLLAFSCHSLFFFFRGVALHPILSPYRMPSALFYPCLHASGMLENFVMRKWPQILLLI